MKYSMEFETPKEERKEGNIQMHERGLSQNYLRNSRTFIDATNRFRKKRRGIPEFRR